jgi:hypothetical protein
VRNITRFRQSYGEKFRFRNLMPRQSPEVLSSSELVLLIGIQDTKIMNSLAADKQPSTCDNFTFAANCNHFN